MKIVENRIVPFEGFLALSFAGLIFVRRGKKDKVTDRVVNHEAIHARQQRELLWLPFLLWYGIEWLVKLSVYRDGHEAYRNLSFEREAYDNESNPDYLRERKPYAWLKYVTCAPVS